jgi:deoxyribodipyrimidine photo-lyase
MRLVWHRGDLRTHDHPALSAAFGAGPAAGVVVLDPAILDATSARRRVFFRRHVGALRDAYHRKGGVLLVRHGNPAAELVALVDRLRDVERVHAIASYTPYGVHRDREALSALRGRGVGVRWHDGAYVHSPGTVRTADDGFYSVYAPFFRRWRSLGTPDPVPAPDALPAPDRARALDPGEIPAEDPGIELPPIGEDAALDALERFVDEGLPAYAERRDRLDGRGTSRLSVWITIGALSARAAAARVEAAGGAGVRKWLAELGWRDFLADLLYHRPDLLDAPFQPRWKALDWPGGDDRFEAWREGRTGVPTVDAAMRQLRETGWISNRARMVAAQFLGKNLRVDWRRGEAVFKDWLLDGDTASNAGNWQWAAGLGIDNAPYFRVMNPVTQAEKHDPDGEWLARWAPDSDGDPTPRDPVVDPGASRKAYIEAAEAVPAAERAGPAPPPRRPALELATDEQLASVDGVGPATAAAALDAVAARGHSALESAPGVGRAIADALRRRFDG